MRYLKSFVSLLIPGIFIYFLNSGIGSMPPLGKIMDPVRGFMANAENKNVFESENITFADQNIRGRIYLDERLVPHLFAEDDRSIYFLQGYITAKYRLWQMDIQTRAAAGRLSEIFGEDFIPYDKEQRRKGMVYAAEKALEEIKKDPIIFNAMQAYTDGVNAFLSPKSNSDREIEIPYAEYPLEFKLINYKPEPWSVLKSALLLKYMANTLTGFDDDIESSNLLKLLGEENFNLLYPDRPAGIDPIIPSEVKYDFQVKDTIAKNNKIADLYFQKVTDLFESQHEKNQIGSNNWVVSGSKTKSGNPILCNDPHLQLNLPSLWYEIQLQTPTFNCYGVSLPGAPAIVIGFNDSISWGVTNAQIDVRDWYQITFQDETKKQYKYGDTWRNTTTRIEKIEVKGGGTIHDTVYYTHYGPIVYDSTELTSDEKPSTEFMQRAGFAMRWTAHLPSAEVKTFYLLNRAKNYDDYREAISYFDCPAQNFIFGSTSGDIAITQRGNLPIKYPGQGRFILDGSDPGDDYQEYIPYEHNPTVKNPSTGFCASANQHPTDSTYPYYYTSFDFEFYRNRVINNELKRLNNITIEDMQDLQQNNFNMLASEILPKFFEVLDSAKINVIRNDNNNQTILKTLRGWDYYNHADSLSPTYFQIWWDTMYALLWDEMNDENIAFVAPNNYNTVNFLLNAPTDHFLFDVKHSIDKKETLNDIIESSFYAMLDEIDSIRDSNNAALIWYQKKATSIMHISRIPAFSKTNIHNGGYKNIVNATSQTHGPSWRMVVELSDPMNAYGVYPGGQSGNPGSFYFDNFIDDWAAGKYYKLQFFKTEDEAKTKSKCIITCKG